MGSFSSKLQFQHGYLVLEFKVLHSNFIIIHGKQNVKQNPIA